MNTKARVHGSDAPFNDWIRNNKSVSSEKGYCLEDVDSCLFAWHKYSANGSRSRQQIMLIETKRYTSSWSAETYQKQNTPQLDTFSKLHLCCKGTYEFTDEAGDKLLRNHGVSFLVMDADTPPASSVMYWGRFKWISSIQIFDQLQWVQLEGVEQLEALLRFEIDPDFGLTGE